MEMEPRSVGLTVFLRHEGLRVARCRARVIGPSRIFIYANPLLYRKDQVIQIDILPSREGGTPCRTCSALVRRRNTAGLEVTLGSEARRAIASRMAADAADSDDLSADSWTGSARLG